MSSSLIFALWLAWLTGLAVVAVLRQRAVSVERQQRVERRQLREARPRHKVSMQSVAPDHRNQLIAAGIIRPAPAPEILPDPVTSM